MTKMMTKLEDDAKGDDEEDDTEKSNWRFDSLRAIYVEQTYTNSQVHMGDNEQLVTCA